MTLVLRKSKRLAKWANHSCVTLLEGGIEDARVMDQAMKGEAIVYVAPVDITPDSRVTSIVISSMKRYQVRHLLSSNAMGIYHEVEGEFGLANQEAIDDVFEELCQSEQLVVNSGLDYMIIHIPCLHDKHHLDHVVTGCFEPFYSQYVSRKSVADLVLNIIGNSVFGLHDSLALAEAR